MKLTIHVHLIPWLRMSGATLLHRLYASIAWTGNFFLTLQGFNIKYCSTEHYSCSVVTANGIESYKVKEKYFMTYFIYDCCFGNLFNLFSNNIFIPLN